MAQFRQKPLDYKSGALPSELSRHCLERRGKPLFSPTLGFPRGQGGSEQSGKIGHIAAQVWHNPCHTVPA